MRVEYDADRVTVMSMDEDGMSDIRSGLRWEGF